MIKPSFVGLILLLLFSREKWFRLFAEAFFAENWNRFSSNVKLWRWTFFKAEFIIITVYYCCCCWWWWCWLWCWCWSAELVFAKNAFLFVFWWCPFHFHGKKKTSLIRLMMMHSLARPFYSSPQLINFRRKRPQLFCRH